MSWPLWLLLVACAGKQAPPSTSLSVTELTDARLNQWVHALAPQVEAAAGARFVELPYARLGSYSELSQVLSDESRLILSQLFDAPTWVIERMVAENASAAGAVIGKYGLQTKVLYLSTDALTQMVASGRLSAGELEIAAQLVLVHELTHALQDQVVQLEPIFKSLQDTEALEAFSAVNEGHANAVTRRVSALHSWDATSDALDRSQGWTSEGPLSPGAFSIWFRYGLGQAFIERIWTTGEPEHVWSLLRTPPRTTTALFRPEKVGTIPLFSPDEVRRLVGLEEQLTSGPWTRLSSVVGERDLRLEAQHRTTHELDALLEGFVRGAQLNALRQDREATLRVMDFRSAASAQSYVRGVSTRADSTQTEGALSLTWTVQPVEAEGADLAVRRVLSLGVLSLEVTTLWVVRASRVVEVRTKGFRPGLRLERTAEALRTVFDD